MRKERVLKRVLFVTIIIFSLGLQSAYMLLPNNGILYLDITENMSYVNLRVILISFLGLNGAALLCINNKMGRIVAYIIYANALITMGITMYYSKSISSISGVIAIFIAIGCSTLISHKLMTNEKASVYDPVTGDVNKNGLQREIVRQDYDNMAYYIMVVHIRNMTVINDNLGFEYGDKAVCEVSKRLISLVNGRGIVGKLDNEDYAIAIEKTDYIKDVAESILACFTMPIEITLDGVVTNIYLRACAGISEAPIDAEDLSGLIRCADIAMFAANKNIEDSIVFYTSELKKEQERRNEVEFLLKDSIRNEYLYMVYQPQYTARAKRLRGFEALVRMKLPDGSGVSPAEFVPIAEKAGIMNQLDDYVLAHSMKEYKQMIEKSGFKGILSVNVSSEHFASNRFVGYIERLLAENSFPAECLELEIKEYSMNVSTVQTRDNMEALKKRGVKISLDDFGTGYSSFAQIIKLPFDTLKIDKSLMDRMLEDETTRDFVKLVIYMGHLINAKVISEGVETEEQVNLLSENKCDFVQGYVWGKPVPYDEAIEVCEKSSKLY